MVFEADPVLAASFQDVVTCCLELVYDSKEAEIGVVGMEEAENHRMGRSGSSEAHSGIEVVARLETVMDHFGIDSVARSEKEALHSGIAEDYFGMEWNHSETEEAAHFEIEVESQGRFAGEIVEAAQKLDSAVDQNPAVVGGTETAIAERVVVAGRKVEERQNRTSFEAELQTAFAVAAAVGDSLASQPCPKLLVTVG